jgi:hypothetical protein
MSQSKAFQAHVMAALPIGGAVELTGGYTGTVLFHTESMEHELTGVRVKFADGQVEDISYSDILAPEWERAERMGRPSQGRSVRIQAQVTPEIADWLQAQKQQGESTSDVVFRLLETWSTAK